MNLLLSVLYFYIFILFILFILLILFFILTILFTLLFQLLFLKILILLLLSIVILILILVAIAQLLIPIIIPPPNIIHIANRNLHKPLLDNNGSLLPTKSKPPKQSCPELTARGMVQSQDQHQDEDVDDY